MANLSEKERIQILIIVGCGDKIRSHEEACQFFNAENPNRAPISRSTVSKIVAKFAETGSVKDRARQGRPRIEEDRRLNILLEIQDNPHTSTRNIARIMQSILPQ